jgi:glyoxylate reductase
MRLLYTARAPKPEAEALGATFCDLDTLLAESDFVSLHVPLTPETTYLVNRERLRLMKPDAILINTARGPVVDTNALIEALEAGRIGGVGLDVTDPEPLPSDHRLLTFPNVIVTPHIASAGRQTRADMAMLVARNILAVFAGKVPPSALFALE